MKRLAIAALAAALFVPLLGLAQPDGSGGPPPGEGGPPPGGSMRQPDVAEQVKKLDKLLKLSDEQKTKITVVLTQQNEDAQKVFENESATFTDKRASLKDIRESANAKITELLTEDQQKKFAEYVKKNQRSSGNASSDGEGPGGTPPDGPPPGDGGGPGGGGPGGGGGF